MSIDVINWSLSYQEILDNFRAEVSEQRKCIEDLRKENAKLRELVRILAYCMSEDRDCDKCVLNGADMPTPRISACDSLPDRMRELEVEADG